MEAFKKLGITAQFLRPLEAQGISMPTEIQLKAIPVALSQKDVVAIAPTGTGKTLAFLLPLLMTLKFRKDVGTRALILLPSKELAVQVAGVLELLMEGCDLTFALLYGGVGRSAQIERLTDAPDIVVATPARFKDLYFLGHIELKKLEFLVLDEADRMLDGGFITQLRDILELIPTKRRTLLFSATFPEKAKLLLSDILEQPVYVEVEAIRSLSNTKQKIVHLENHLTKIKALEMLLQDTMYERVLVFCKSKESARQTHHFLSRKYLDQCGIITSNKAQNARLEAFNRFNDGVLRVLITTDVCARGIDVNDVSHVVQMDVARDADEFIHRSGRTGRMNKAGINITFCTEKEQYYFKKIKEALGLNPELLVLEVSEQEYMPGEKQQEARELDLQRQKDDPNYAGAFHKKKKIYAKKKFFRK